MSYKPGGGLLKNRCVYREVPAPVVCDTCGGPGRVGMNKYGSPINICQTCLMIEGSTR